MQPACAKRENSVFVLEPITRVQTAELVERRIGDAASTIGRAVECFVVYDHDVIIDRRAEIHLEHVDPEIARVLERVERVLWPQTPAASMSDAPRTRRLEENVLAYAVVRVDGGEIDGTKLPIVRGGRAPIGENACPAFYREAVTPSASPMPNAEYRPRLDLLPNHIRNPSLFVAPTLDATGKRRSLHPSRLSVPSHRT